MPLPAELNQAIAVAGGGRIALVIGAGCSVEAPTSVPVARICSIEIHRQLVADGVLAAGDCAQPEDLSSVTDAVFARTQSQQAVVSRMRDYFSLRARPANEGYLIAAALLCEGVVTAIVTLNFDVGLTNAISDLTCGEVVGIIEGPEQLPQQKGRNIYYLHRSANTTDAESWVLRSHAIQAEWQGRWQQPITQSVLSRPVVVFAGLGTPVTVLLETVQLLRASIPDATRLFQVDPGASATSRFFQELHLTAADYIQLGWCDFMRELSARLTAEHGALISAAATQIVNENGVAGENITALLAQLQIHGAVRSGKFRASWLLHDKKIYLPMEGVTPALLGDLLLGVALISRVAGASATIGDDGIVEFRRGAVVVATVIMVSGSGHLKMSSIDARTNKRKLAWRSRASQPTGALVAGTSEIRAPITPPTDVVRGNGPERDIVAGQAGLRFYHVDELRQDVGNVAHLVP